MIPDYRAPLTPDGHMASTDDWATLVDAALRLCNFTGAKVTVEFPDGKAYVATVIPDGASFGAVEQATITKLRLFPGGAA